MTFLRIDECHRVRPGKASKVESRGRNFKNVLNEINQHNFFAPFMNFKSIQKLR